MNHFHATDKKKAFFEGWYLKHQNTKETLALIPGIQIDRKGQKIAFIQVISDNESHFVTFPFAQFKADHKRFSVTIGENQFDDRGISLNIKTKKLSLNGKLIYGKFSPIRYDIMGPFAAFPFLECNHGILSMFHKVTGQLCFQGRQIDFIQGRGYLEKDWGVSFPKRYFWSQCNWFPNQNCSIIVSAADIPFLGTCFLGTICVIHYRGKEYRLATYLGAKILNLDANTLMLKQGGYLLKVDVKSPNSHRLKAPVMGNMSRIIREAPSCIVRYRLVKDERLIFDLSSDRAGFEYVKENG